MVMRPIRALVSLVACALLLGPLPVHVQAGGAIPYNDAPPSALIGGAWVWPRGDMAFRAGETVGFAAAAYAEGIVERVTFTVRTGSAGGEWVVACSTDRRDDTRLYRCPWAIPADSPLGEVQVGFAVYTRDRYRKEYPDGLRVIRIEDTSATIAVIER